MRICDILCILVAEGAAKLTKLKLQRNCRWHRLRWQFLLDGQSWHTANFQPLELFERPNQGQIANCLARERSNTFKEFYVCSNCTYFVELWPQLCSLNTYKSLHLLSIIGILLSKLQQTSFELSHSAISASATIYAFRSSGLIPKSSPLGTTKSDPLHWSVGTQLERK